MLYWTVDWPPLYLMLPIACEGALHRKAYVICTILWIMVKSLGLLLSFLRVDSQKSPSDTENFSDSLLNPFLVEAISDFPADSFRNNMKDFANDCLNRAACLNNLDETVTDIVCTALPAVVSNNRMAISFPANMQREDDSSISPILCVLSFCLRSKRQSKNWTRRKYLMGSFLVLLRMRSGP